VRARREPNDRRRRARAFVRDDARAVAVDDEQVERVVRREVGGQPAGQRGDRQRAARRRLRIARPVRRSSARPTPVFATASHVPPGGAVATREHAGRDLAGIVGEPLAELVAVRGERDGVRRAGSQRRRIVHI
jgi:hypothetical protein